nr:DUF4133 domain-containing protein [uncultured Carboxylicivirga sp.]
MKGKEYYHISKVDDRIYIKGFSGVLVYKALYTILGAFGGFTVLYLLTGPLPAVVLVVPSLLLILYRLNILQKTYGPEGYQKRRMSRRLPDFVSVKRRPSTYLPDKIEK